MSVTIKILWGALGFGLILGAISLATWGIPAPTGEVKVTFSNDRFLNKKNDS
ncbi:MAG: hypothetical protein KBB83_04360 [Alphaproteobacteria bacterium]|nr:hypothetical protein [Alphaproteobacteria bacterium]